MKVYFLITFILAIVIQIFAQNNAPEVTNVIFSQRTDESFIVDVFYDLNDFDGDTMLLSMEVSDDGGATWNFACDSISGDVGPNHLSGTGKHIVWDFGAEHPQTSGNVFIIKILANDRPIKMGIVTDIDGNIYQTVKIGNQWWMAENLRVTHYRNGDAIPHVKDNYTWSNTILGAYCNYDNDTSNVATYGKLYNWNAAVNTKNIAPQGWHMPSDVEWQTLIDYLGGDSVAGGKMKSTGTIQGGDGLWWSPNTGATNESGFSGLPGGHRWYTGLFSGLPGEAYFWSTTIRLAYQAWGRKLIFNSINVRRIAPYQQSGLSVRCVRD